METRFNELKTRLAQVDDLRSARAVLEWDLSTYMPERGTESRGRQLATLGKLAHEQFTDPAIGELLERIRPWAEAQPYDSIAAGLVRATQRDYDRAVKVPSEYTHRFAQHASKTYAAWSKARPRNDFKAVVPLLEKTLDLSREYSSFFPGAAHVADPLIDVADSGIKTAAIKTLLTELKVQLVPMVEAICGQQAPDTSCLRKVFPQEDQVGLSKSLAGEIGFDFARGRIDQTRHPFMVRFSGNDIRILTRTRPDDISECLFSTLHEAGHGIYEQGISPSLDGLSLAHGTSAGVHESQSRLWENLVARSRGFWTRHLPRLRAAFPDQTSGVDVETFYRAINKVSRSLIRTDADEVTYNLHIMVRFELEIELLEGTLAVKDLAEAWRAKYRSTLGLEPPDDKDGVLQDVHWYGATIGGQFQCYAIGNILAAQFYEAAVSAHPQIAGDSDNGEYARLYGWLKKNVYEPGGKLTAPELVKTTTGEDLTIAPYLRYLRRKYGELYRLD